MLLNGDLGTLRDAHGASRGCGSLYSREDGKVGFGTALISRMQGLPATSCTIESIHNVLPCIHCGTIGCTTRRCFLRSVVSRFVIRCLCFQEHANRHSLLCWITPWESVSCDNLSSAHAKVTHCSLENRVYRVNEGPVDGPKTRRESEVWSDTRSRKYPLCSIAAMLRGDSPRAVSWL